MGSSLQSLLMLSAQAGIVAVVVWCVIAMLGRWLSPAGRYALWFLVAVRLVLPAPASRFSLYNLIGVAPKTGSALPTLAARVTYLNTVPEEASRIFRPANAAAAGRAALGCWDYLAVLWLVGAIGGAGLFLFSILRFNRRIRADHVVDDGATLALLGECMRDMRVNRRVEIRETSAILTPALAGLVRPELLLPAGMREKLSRDELRYVILHELAHLRRHDIAVDRVLSVLQCLHWFNPAVYFSFSRLRAERELLRDRAVLTVCGERDRVQYGRTLLRLARMPGAALVPGAIGIIEPKHDLRRRIHAIAEAGRGRIVSRMFSITAVMVIACVVLTGRRDGRVAAAAQASTQPVADTGLQAVRSFTLIEKPFSKVIEQIAGQAALVAVIDARALTAAGIADFPVSGTFPSMRCEEILKQVLEEAPAGKSTAEYQVDSGMLIVSTHDGFAESSTTTRVYDVRDLTVPIPGFTQTQNVDAHGNPVPASKAEVERQHVAERDKLIARLKKEIAPASWGKSGSIAAFGTDQLIVTQTPVRHLQVAALIEMIRQKRGAEVVVEIQFIRCTTSEVMNNAMLKTLPVGTGRVLKQAQTWRFINDAQRGTESSVVTAPRLTLFNGQTAKLFIGQDISYVKEIVADANGRLKPSASTVETGVKADVRASTTDDLRKVTVDGKFVLQSLLEMPTVAAPNDASLRIQMPVVRNSTNALSIEMQSGDTYWFASPPAEILPKGVKTNVRVDESRTFILVKATAMQARQAE